MQDEKIRVLIVDNIADTRESIQKLLLFDKSIEVIGTIGTAKDAIQMATEKQPHVVLMDINMSDMDGIAATEAMRKKVPFVQVIILSVNDDLNIMRRAMMAGARDFLTKPPDVDQLVEAIHRSHDLAKEEINKMGTVGVAGVSPAGDTIYRSAIFGKVIMIYSPKGGTGVTTLATNLAVTLNSTATNVVLVDGSLQFGDVTVFLNEQPRLSIADLAPRADELDPEIINEVLINHAQTGLRILAAVPRPEMADKITGQQFVKILQFLRRLYHFVIIDTSSYLTEPIIAALDEADLIVLLTTQDIPAIRDTKIFLNLVESFNISKEKLLFVLSKSDKRIPITPEKVSEALKNEVKLEILFDDRTVINSVNRGMPFVLDPKPQPIVRNIMDLADTIRSILISETQTEGEIRG
ncbi:MAG: response regulator [Anaerolineaceae bacterium]|nr:response regulator [Anaerolineaceae bacterium]MBN2677225.1 response regulator [Anaerolineaceae bacterium]